MEQVIKRPRSVGAIVTGILVSLTVLVLGSLCSAWLIYRGTVEMKDIGYLVMGSLFLSGISGGVATVINTKEKMLIAGCIISATVFLILLCMGMLFFDGSFFGVGQTVLLLLGACVSTILVGTHRKERSKPRHRRIRNG